MARVAVVILNWNGEAMLDRFLGGVVASLPEWARVVVADNGSTDRSCDYLRRQFPQLQLISLDRNYGFAEGYNRALKELDEEIVVLLNSDVETPKGWLEPLVECLDRHPEVGAVGPKLRALVAPDHFEYAGAAGGYIDLLGYPFCRGRILQTIERDEGQYDDEREVFWLSGAALCIRRPLFEELGGFDSAFFAHMEEIDLAWRMQLRGLRLRIVPRSVVYHLGGATLAVGSPLKIFLNHRNNLRMLFRCASPSQRLLVALLRPLTDLAAAFSYLLQGHLRAFCSVFRAWWVFLAEHNRLKKERRLIRQSAQNNPVGLYYGSIILRYLFGMRRFHKMM